MFWNKKKKNNDNIITTVVTRTSEEAQHKKDIQSEAEKQSRICPECGHVNSEENISLPCIIQDTNIHILHSICEECKAQWETEYRI